MAQDGMIQDPYSTGEAKAIYNDAAGTIFRCHILWQSVHQAKHQDRYVEYVKWLERLLSEVASKLGNDKTKALAMYETALKKAYEFQAIQFDKKVTISYQSKKHDEAHKAGMDFEIFLREIMDKKGMGMPNEQEASFFDDQ